MIPTRRVVPAGPGDIAGIVTLLNGVTAWMRSRGSAQWAGAAWTAHEVMPAVYDGSAYVIRPVDDGGSTGAGSTGVGGPKGGVAGFMVVDDYADPQFWRADDHPADARYVHHLAVDRAWAGRGVGALLLRHARTLAAVAGSSWLRLDAPRDNARLHRYYRDQGFFHVRTATVVDRASGALFQTPARDGPRQPRLDTKMQNGWPVGSA